MNEERRFYVKQKIFLVCCALSFLCSICLSSVNAQTAPSLDLRLQKPMVELGAYGIPVSTKIHAMTLQGTYLSYVQPGSRADRSGLRKGDIVVKINSLGTANPTYLNYVISKLHGQIIQIDYLRGNGRSYDVRKTPLIQINQGIGEAYSRRGVPSTNFSYGSKTGSNISSRIPVQDLENIFCKLIEEDRAKNGLTTPLKASTRLARMARAYADDMSKRGFTGHVDPEGRAPLERARMAGITPRAFIAENCAYPFPQPNATQMVKEGENNLISSEDHKVNIMNPANKSFGVGIAYRADGGLMVVQEFSGEEIP